MKLKLKENADINVVTGISDIIIDSINKKWDNIRDFNSIIVNLNEEGYEELVPVIESILEDENKNVGKLQQLVELISPTAKSIDDGRQEAIDELDNIDTEVEEEMKLSENFSNVPDKTTTTVDPSFGKAIEDHDEDNKEFEDALKENEKLANETIPKEGDTGKKVTSKALKAMHLSEALFDEDLEQEEQHDFNSDVFHALEDVAFKWRNKHVTPDEWVSALEWFEFHFIDDGEWEEYTENFKLGEEVSLTEDTDSPDKKKELLKKKLGNFLINKSKQYNMNISDKDKMEFIKFAMDMVIKASRHEKIDGKDIADMVNKLFKSSFNLKGEYTRSMEEKLLTEDKEESKDSIKLDIAKEQIKRFKEGKMPKDWQPKDYINELVKRNHLTKEEGDKLLSEGINESLDTIDDFRSWMKMLLSDIKQSYHLLLNNDLDSIDLAISLIESSKENIEELYDSMRNFNWENNE